MVPPARSTNAKNEPYVLSRKVKLAIDRNLRALIAKTYTEVTVKELLIDLREVTKYRNKNLDTPPDPRFTQAFKDFTDVCDSAAHTNRDRGILEQNIRRYVRTLDAAFNEGGEKPVPQIDRVASGDGIVAAMLATIFFYLDAFDKKFDRNQLTPVFEDKADIGLCIISLLQDTIITLDDDKGKAHLRVLDHEGKFRLYCSILDSPIDRSARARTGGSGHVMISFPVIETNARNIDNLSFDAQGQVPSLIETFRADDGCLHARILSNG